MKIIEIEKRLLKKDFFDDVMFFMFAESGAMGDPGAIYIVRTDDIVYYTNYMFGEIELSEIVGVFPALDKCSFGLFGMDSCVPEGWHYVNLGMGNHLVVKAVVYEQFKEMSKCCKSPGEIYQQWTNYAININQREV